MCSTHARRASFRASLPLAAGLSLALGGCLGIPDLTANGAPPALPGKGAERAAAIAEIRAEAAAGDKMPYPDAFQSEQTLRLASRGEPLTVPEVEAAQTELALIAKRRATVTDKREIAALEVRARELRRIILQNGGTAVRE